MVASLKRRGFCLPTCSRIGRGASALSMRRKLVVAVLGLVFASCFNLTERGLRGVPSGPMSWRIGYSDGCRSGRLTVLDYGYWQRDKERYRIDDLYRQGWDEAFRACAERARAEQSSPVAAVRAATPVGAGAPVAATPALVASPPTEEATPPPVVPQLPTSLETVGEKPPKPEQAAPSPASTQRDAITERIRQLEDEVSRLKSQLQQVEE